MLEIGSSDLLENYENGIAKSASIDLSLGTYQVVVNMDGLGAYATIDLKCEKSTFRALRTNMCHLFAGDKSVAFEAYVVGEVEDAYFALTINEADIEHIESIVLWKTNKAFIMLFVIVLTIFSIINALVWYREQMQAGRYTRRQQGIFWGICAAVGISYLPYATDYFMIQCDLPFHLLRIEGLQESLLNGAFPVRVQDYWLYDHGYAVSMFYGDLCLLLPAFLRIIGFSLMTAYKVFVLVVMIATAMICYYSLKKCTKDAEAAFLGTILYTLAPYRIYNVYCRGAVGEYLAMMFFPLIVCGIYQLLQQDIQAENYKKAKLPLIIGMTGVLNSHMLSTEITIIALLLICIIFWKKVIRKETFIQLLQAAGVCLLINCWFWMPFLWMFTQDSYVLSDNVSKSIQYMGTWFATLFQITPYKGTAQNGMYLSEPIHLGVAGSALLILWGALLWIGGKKRKEWCKGKTWKTLLFFAVITIVCVVLSTRYFPWDFIGSLKGIGFLADVLQFPTRFMALATLFCTCFASFFVCWIKEISQETFWNIEERVKYLLVGFILILVVISATFQTGEICVDSQAHRLYIAENMGSTQIGSGEYLLEGTLLKDYHYHEPLAEEGLYYSGYRKNGTNITLVLQNDAQQTKYIELPLTGYKGYKVMQEEAEKKVEITEERGQHGDLRLAVPAGFSGEIEVSYTGPIWFKIAEYISLISVLLLLANWMIKKRKRCKNGAA